MELGHAHRSVTRRTSRLLLVLVTATTVLGGESAEAQAPIGILKDMSASATSLRDSVVALARAQIGSRYRHGGSTPRAGFDCSGLVQYVMARVSMILPRTARQQASIGVAVERDTSQLRPGDLLTFSARDRGAVSHVGIYVGAGRFVHASSVAGRVIESPLFRPPAPKIKVWTGVRRIPWWSEELAFADPVVTPER